MSKFCSNCGNALEDNAMFCNKCGTQTINNQINNNQVYGVNNTTTKKKVKFHWGIPTALFVQFMVVWILNTLVRVIDMERLRNCIENCEPSIFVNIMSVILIISMIAFAFVFPSLIAVIIVYVVQKGNNN